MGAAARLQAGHGSVADLAAALDTHEQLGHQLLAAPVNRQAFALEKQHIEGLFTAAAAVQAADDTRPAALSQAQQDWQAGLEKGGLWGDQVLGLTGSNVADTQPSRPQARTCGPSWRPSNAPRSGLWTGGSWTPAWRSGPRRRRTSRSCCGRPIRPCTGRSMGAKPGSRTSADATRRPPPGAPPATRARCWRLRAETVSVPGRQRRQATAQLQPSSWNLFVLSAARGWRDALL